MALNVTRDSIRGIARVGLLSPQGSEQFSSTIEHLGHEVVACSSWSELLTKEHQGPLDLVFCHESCLDSMPNAYGAPVLRMQDAGTFDEQALQPMLALAV